MKQKKEIEVIETMIRIYCKKKHGYKKELCSDCQELFDYALFRQSKCPFKDEKPFCSNCKIHCYKPDMKEKIKDVMRFSGPRMVLYHPIVAIKHVLQSHSEKKKMEKKGN